MDGTTRWKAVGSGPTTQSNWIYVAAKIGGRPMETIIQQQAILYFALILFFSAIALVIDFDEYEVVVEEDDEVETK
jgi:hypothetical protein